MASNLVKLRPETYSRVKELSQEYQVSMQEVVARGLDALERQEFARGFQEDFAVLRGDVTAWGEETSERRVLEDAVEDGID